MNFDWSGLQVLDDDRPRDAAGQMAADALLVHSSSNPVLRFFLWSDCRQATCGRATDPQEVRQRFPEWNWARRPTGGGLVFHDSDCTFSVILPRIPRQPAGLSAREFYATLHRLLAQALQNLGIAVQLAPESPGSAASTSPCFAAPVPFDLVRPGGEKIAGGALRRTRTTWLYQGSIRAPGVSSRVLLPTLPNLLHPHWTPHPGFSPAEEAFIAATQSGFLY